MRTVITLWMLLSSAWAGPKLVVLETIGPKGTAPAQLMHWTDTVRGVVRAHAPSHLVVLTRENIEAFLPPDVDLADCDGECEITTGRKIGAEYVVGVRVVRAADAWKVTVALHATIDGRFLGQGQVSVPHSQVDAGLRTAAREAIEVLAPRSDEGPTPGDAQVVHARPLKWLGAPILRLESDLEVPITLHAKGRRIGTTPVNLLLDGAKEIRLTAQAQGYQTRHFRVVTGGGSGTAELRLPSAQTHVQLDVPFGDVEVHLGGLSFQGRDQVVQAGTYPVRVQHRCLEAPVFEAKLEAGKTVSLEVPHRITCGNVKITSPTPDAEVHWRGAWRALPFEGPIEPTIETPIMIRAPGYNLVERTVTNAETGTRTYDVPLEPDMVDVEIQVRRWNQEPCRAPVYVGTRFVGISPWQGQLQSGTYRISADCDGYTLKKRESISNGPMIVQLKRQAPRADFLLTTTAFNSTMATVRLWSDTHRQGALRASIGLTLGGFGFRDDLAGGVGLEAGIGLPVTDWLELGGSALGALGGRPCTQQEKAEREAENNDAGCAHAYGEVRALMRLYAGKWVVEAGWGLTGQAYVETSSRSGAHLGLGISF